MRLFLMGVGIVVLAATAITVQAQQAASVVSEAELVAMDRFQAEHPGTLFLREGSTLSRVYGRTFEVGESPVATASRFVAANAPLFGCQASDLVAVSRLPDGRHTQPLMYNHKTGEYKFTLVYYSQYRSGLPVFRSDLRLLVRNDTDYPLVLAASSLRRLGDFTADPIVANLEFDPALRTNTGMTRFTTPTKVIWAGIEDDAAEPVLAVTFVGENDRTDSGYECWRFVCDAATGEILYKETMIHFVDVTGTVKGMATPGAKANICTDEILFNYPWAKVDISGGSTVYADGSGNFTIPNAGAGSVTVRSYVDGLYFTIDNRAGSEETLSTSVTPPGPVNFVHCQTVTDQVLAQTNIYVAGNQCRDWILSQNPSFPGISTETGVLTVVNRTDGYCPCNAWSSSADGSINFCLPGVSGTCTCPNTAWQSVLNHEYGHHVVDKTSSGQDEYGEGMADCISMLPVDDPNLGYGFCSDCNAGLRTANNTCQYSATSCSSCGSESHDCGMLLSGIVWSIRNQLIVTEPTDYLSILSEMVVNSIMVHTGTSINQQIAIDFLALDDNDSNPSNGTPHHAEICAGFSAHGISCPALPPVSFEYPSGRPATATPNLATTFPVNVVALANNPVAGTGQLHYSLDGGSYTAVSMTETTANHYIATLPAADCNHRYNWYVSAQASGVGTVNDPSNAPTASYSTIVATGTTTPFQDDFETDKGWTVGDTGDNATTGLWTRNVPQATTAQPGADHSDPGTMCWVTDYRAGSSVGSYDVDGGKTTLKSPTINLSAVSEPTIGYWRWYSNDKGDSPHADTFVVDISNNNGSTWVNVETVGPTGTETSGGWYYHEFRVADKVTPTAQIKMRFVAQDQGSGSIIEAAIDDFKVSAYTCEIVATCSDGILNQGETRIDCGGPCPACQCTSDAACSDGNFCNGAETCNAYGHCLAGGNPCPGQWCDSGGCFTCSGHNGNMNGDAATNGADIQDFVEAVLAASTSRNDVCPGDFNNNGVVDFGDVSGMVDALLGL